MTLMVWVSRLKLSEGGGSVRGMSPYDENLNEDPRGPDQRFSVNVHPPSNESSIWRYMDMHAALQTVIYNKLRFTRVSKFRDEWESRRGAASRALIEEQDSQMAVFSQMPHHPWPNQPLDNFYRENNFVSSWTRVEPDHMAMWLAYTNSDASVAIESSVSLLAKTSTVNLDYADLGEIAYVDPDVWVHESRDNRELLYVKRPAFDFEREVRFAIQPIGTHASLGNPDDYVELPIKTGTITGMVTHPYMDESTFNLLIEMLAKFKIEIEIKRSSIGNKHTY